MISSDEMIKDRVVNHYHGEISGSSVARIRRAQDRLMQREVSR